MKRNQNRIIASVWVLLVCMACADAQDWPQYLGPHRNGVSDQKGILRTWPENGPEVLWAVDVGIGFGGPVVRDGRVFLLDRDDSVGDNMRCFDLCSGKELWNFEYEAPGSFMFPGSRSVPTVDGDCVYSCGPYGDLYCIDINTHQPVWTRNVWTDFGGEEIPIWAITQCPLVYDNFLILASQAPDAGVVAYDKHSGELIWKTPNLGNETYVSPQVVKIDGEDHVVMVTSSTNPIARPDAEYILGNIVGMDPLTGEILWKYTEWDCHISVPGAVDAGDNKILVTGGYELGSVMIQVEKKEDGSYGTTELFKTVEFGAHTIPPILHDGYFYSQYGTNNRREGLVCMSMDGRIMWKTGRSPNFNKGSMILADGLFLATDGGKTLYLIEPDSLAFKPVASSVLLIERPIQDEFFARFGNQNWAPMALADGKLLIRDQNHLLCVRIAE